MEEIAKSAYDILPKEYEVYLCETYNGKEEMECLKEKV